MDVYIFRGDIYSALAGEQCRQQLTDEGKAPADPDNESTYDSDDFPKGPYPNGGGEADTPQHCARYGTFLENPLTEDGSAYVKSAFKAYAEDGRGDRATLALWQEAYINEYSEACEEQDREGLPPVPDFRDPSATYTDGEITGLDPATGYIIQWGDDADAGRPGFYVSGETPEQYGLDGLTDAELDRLKAAGWRPA